MEHTSALRRGASLVAAALAAFSVVNVATTFLPGPPVLGMGPTLTVFVIVFPLFAVALLWVSLRPGRGGPGEVNKELGRQWRILSRPLRRGLSALVITLWLCGLSGFVLGPNGQPHEDDGRHYLNNHGTETEITKAEYEDAVQHNVRSFASGNAVLLVTIAVLFRFFRPGSRSPSQRHGR
jgi:hypothetical protein